MKKNTMSAGFHRLRKAHFAQQRAAAIPDEPSIEEEIAQELETKPDETPVQAPSRKGRPKKPQKPFVRDPAREAHEERKRIFVKQILMMAKGRKRKGRVIHLSPELLDQEGIDVDSDSDDNIEKI